MATLRITESDRDAEGKIRVAPATAAMSRSLADLLPATEAAASATSSATERQGPPVATILGVLGGLALAVVLILVLGRVAPDAPARSLAAPTAAATSVPTATPFGAALDGALVAYFDYQRPDTATALDHGTRVQPIARIGREWLQVQLASGAAVWVRWRDLPAPSAALDALPDLAPPTPLPTDPPTAAPVPVFAPPPPPPQPTVDTRPISCVTTDAGQICRRGLDAHDGAVATEIAATSEAYNAPFQAAYNATATALAQPHLAPPR